MVGITDDGRGLRYIQLANGSRYYEGSLLRSGAELTRIEDDHLVITGGPPPPGRAPP
jgi:type III secretion protein D